MLGMALLARGQIDLMSFSAGANVTSFNKTKKIVLSMITAVENGHFDGFVYFWFSIKMSPTMPPAFVAL